jgi:hypothetical protein
VYFKGFHIDIEAVPLPGFSFSHWDGAVNSSNPLVRLIPETDIGLTAHFVSTPLPELISFWYFNTELPNDTPLETIAPKFSIFPHSNLSYQSCLEGYPFSDGHDLWRKASIERRNSPTPVNYLPEGNSNIAYQASDMRGVQVKQPLASNGKINQLKFYLPTSGYRDIVFNFAAKDEGASEYIVLEYSINHNNDEWIPFDVPGDENRLESSYKLFSYDFTDISEIENNNNFAIRIFFEGQNLEDDLGNHLVFNNFSLQGVPMNVSVSESIFTSKRIFFYPNPTEEGMIHLSEMMEVMVFDMNGRMVIEMSETQQVNLNGLQPGIYIIRNTAGQTGKLIIPGL